MTDDECCCNWRASGDGHGYGVFWYDNRMFKAHRFSYQLFIDEIPDDMTIDHLCRNKLCANPSHMEVVTLKENILRSDSVSAINVRKKYCPRGHELIDSNLVRSTFVKYNYRICRLCYLIRQRAQYSKRKRELIKSIRRVK